MAGILNKSNSKKGGFYPPLNKMQGGKLE